MVLAENVNPPLERWKSILLLLAQLVECNFPVHFPVHFYDYDHANVC